MKNYGFTEKTLTYGDVMCRFCREDCNGNLLSPCSEFCGVLLDLLRGYDRYVREIEQKKTYQD